MKSNLRNTLLALAVLSLTPIIPLAFSDDDEQGGDIQGTEDMDLHILLTGTTNAPPGASGEAELEAENDDGVTQTLLGFEVKGLPVGTYTVSITTKSDGTNIILGTFDKSADPVAGDEDSQGDSDDQGEDTDQEVEFGGDDGIALPDGLNPMDIATLSISDSNDTVLLTGDFTDAASTLNAVFNANVAVTPGAAAPNALGHAVLHAKTKNGVSRNKFNLVAQGLPPSATLSIIADGAFVGTVNVDSHGKLKMKTLPGGVDVSTLATIELLDGSSNVVFSVSF